VRSGSLLWSFNYAIAGIVYSLRTQRNMRLHAVAAGLVFAGALMLDVARWELVALLFAVTFVITTELLNTAVEAAVDVATEGFDPTAKISKDIAAGAVLVASLNALAIAYLVFFDRLSLLLDGNVHLVKQSPVHVTLIALTATGLAVIVIKALRKEGSFLRGGWPSGHTGLATAAATSIWYMTLSGSITLIAFFLVALVAQSRIEAGYHSIAQTALGAVLAFLVTTLLFQVFWL